MTKQLSNASEIATERTNVTGVMSPILEFQPADGLRLLISGIIAKGDENGFPIYADLRDSAGNQLPTKNTAMSVQFQGPRDDDRNTVTHVQDHIRPYNTLTIEKQQNVENVDAVKHTLKNTDEALDDGKTPRLEVRDVDRFFISIESNTQIDWGQSALYVDKNAVRELSS